jgi:hypothetical protein
MIPMKTQKTIGALLYFLFWILPLPTLRAQTEGVGINTENLQGVFHVDAAANNPSSGDIPDTSQADDIVITPEGYTGAGTLAPSTHLHIHTRNRPDVFPLRIADGSQGEGLMLTSDDDGAASWQMPPVPPSSAVYPVRTVPMQSFPKEIPTPVDNTSFTIPEDGLYSMDVRFWGEGAVWTSYSSVITRNITCFELWRDRGGVEKKVDEFQYNESSFSRISVFFTLYASALQGDVLSLRILQVKGFDNLVTDAHALEGDFPRMRTRILYKKLGVIDDILYFDGND